MPGADNKEEDEAGLSVADRVLKRFLGDLAADEGLADIAATLGKVLLGDGTITEAALREAMFETPGK